MDNDTHPDWRKSTYSNGAGECIEAGHVPGAILVRDTTLHSRGPVLRVTPANWTHFLKSIRG